jgi:uncharacterized protein YdaL
MRVSVVRLFIGVAAGLLAACGGSERGSAPQAGRATERLPTLVLHDDPGRAPAAELDALQVAHLTSHFGPWVTAPVAGYQRGDLLRYRAAVYVGSDPAGAPPAAFLDDVLEGGRPALWIRGNLGALAARAGLGPRCGFEPGPAEATGPVAVVYKGRRLPRDPRDTSPVRGVTVTDASRAKVLATAVRGDGSAFPWAVRAGALTYVAEVPFSWAQDGDRQLVLADLLFDLLAPGTVERHRALVRIEDVSPVVPAADIRALADMLHAAGAPFSVAVIPVFEDPLGAYFGDGVAREIRMSETPEFVAALRYAEDRGATLVMHGYTHQLAALRNPYSGTSGDDFEFWRAHTTDAAGTLVQLDGPVSGDSGGWAAARVRLGLAEFAAAGLAPPSLWEFPHYAGSAADSRAIRAVLPAAYQRGMYFPGLLLGRPEDLLAPLNQAFPYDVTDVYGVRIVPENCGFYSPLVQNAIPRDVPDLLARAAANLVVRDGFASFFFHPWFSPSVLRAIVTGIQAAGYTFVEPEDVLGGSVAAPRLP